MDFILEEMLVYVCMYADVIHSSRPAFGGTIPLSDDLPRCPAFSIFVPLAPIQRENVKKIIQNSYKIFSLNNDVINIESSIFYLLSSLLLTFPRRYIRQYVFQTLFCFP